jgi:hypothetical protein
MIGGHAASSTFASDDRFLAQRRTHSQRVDALEQDEDGAIQSCLSSPKDRRFASGPGQNTVIRSEHNDLAYGGDVGEAIKPRVDVVKPDRAAFEPVDG